MPTPEAQGPSPVPPSEQQIAEQGLITQAPVAEGTAPSPEPVPVPVQPDGQGVMDVMHGGYTGVRVGETANQIARLQAAGKTEEAAALTAQLNQVSPPQEAPKQ